MTALGPPAWDQQAVDWARPLRATWVGDVARLASAIGYIRWLGPLTVVLALALLRWGRYPRHDALLLVLAMSVTAVVNPLLKQVFQRGRPVEGSALEALVGGCSMPSGHSSGAAAFATSLVLVIPPTRAGWIARWLVIAFAATVAGSRIIVGVHFPTDVVAGLLLGTGITLLLAAALRPRAST